MIKNNFSVKKVYTWVERLFLIAENIWKLGEKKASNNHVYLKFKLERVWTLTLSLFLSSQSGKLAKKESDKPKRAPTAYFIFLAEFREQMKGKKIDDNQKIPALAGEKWRTMTDKDKEKYKQQEAVAKKKHEAAMEEWRKKVSVC